MLKSIIPYFNTQLIGLNYFGKMFELCEQLTDDQGNRVVKQYCGNGNFTDVSMFSFNGNTAYWRKTGQIRMSEVPDPMIACGTLLTFSIPLRFVGILKRDTLSYDDQYATERYAQTVMKRLATNGNSLRSLLKARRIEFVVTNVIDNVYPEEFSGKPKPHEYIAVGIDFIVEVLATTACVEDECDYYAPTTCDMFLLAIPESDRLSCILPTFDFSDPTTQAMVSADQQSALITWLCGSCDDATVLNSNSTYSQSVGCGEILELPDQTYDVVLDGTSIGTITLVPLDPNSTINITW